MRGGLRFSCMWMALAALHSPAPGAPPAATRPATAPSAEEIAALVSQLGRGSYRVRQETARRIARCGTAALPALRRELNNPREEIALAARELIARLEYVFFTGASLRLEVDRSRARWNEPVRLRVMVDNRNDYEVHVPWDTSPAPASGPASLARQVGAMLDFAEYATVSAPDAGPIDLRVDPIDDRPDILPAVEERIRRGPVGRVRPGERHVFEIGELNRGWARYPLLRRGRYRIAFVYQPEWEDAEWTREGVGRVAAPEVEIEIIDEAPEAIRTSDQPLTVEIRHEGDEQIALLRCVWDVPQWVNLNLNASGPAGARACWLISAGGQEPTVVDGPAVREAAIERFRLLEPNEAVEILRIRAARLSEAAMREASSGGSGRPAAMARYANGASPSSLRRAAAESGRAADRRLADWAETLERPIVTGEPTSDSFSLE